MPTCDRCEIGERQRIFSSAETHCVRSCIRIFAVSDTVLLHRWATLRRARHSSAAQLFSALLLTGPTQINCTKRLIRRCRALQRAKDLRDTGMSRLRRVNHMCSSTLSVNCEKAEKDTLREPDCRSYFSKRSPLSDFRRANKQGKGRSSKRKENRRCPFLFAPAAGAAVSCAPQSATPR